MFKKYNIIYDAKGRVIGTREVSIKTKPTVVILKTQKEKVLANKIVPGFVKNPTTPKPPGQDRGGKVLAICIEKKIKDPKVIWDMLVEIYAGSKTENYLKGRLQSILSRLP